MSIGQTLIFFLPFLFCLVQTSVPWYPFNPDLDWWKNTIKHMFNIMMFGKSSHRVVADYLVMSPVTATVMANQLLISSRISKILTIWQLWTAERGWGPGRAETARWWVEVVLAQAGCLSEKTRRMRRRKGRPLSGKGGKWGVSSAPHSATLVATGEYYTHLATLVATGECYTHSATLVARGGYSSVDDKCPISTYEGSSISLYPN